MQQDDASPVCCDLEGKFLQWDDAEGLQCLLAAVLGLGLWSMGCPGLCWGSHLGAVCWSEQQLMVWACMSLCFLTALLTPTVISFFLLLQSPIFCLKATVKEAKGILGKDVSGKRKWVGVPLEK